MAAHTKTVAVQSYPLAHFIGEASDMVDDDFEWWIGKSGCKAEQELKLHALGQTAAEVFHMLPEEESSDFCTAVESFHKIFTQFIMSNCVGWKLITRGREVWSIWVSPFSS